MKVIGDMIFINCIKVHACNFDVCKNNQSWHKRNLRSQQVVSYSKRYVSLWGLFLLNFRIIGLQNFLKIVNNTITQPLV